MFDRLLRPIKNKIFLMIGRAVLKAVKNTEGTQKMQALFLADELLQDIERFQEYGFEAYPHDGAEILANFVNGNRRQGVISCVHDRRHRPKDLVEGEVVIYTDEHISAGGHRIHLKRGQIIDVTAKSIIETIMDSITKNTKIVVINATIGITETTPIKTINGDLQVNGKITATGNVKSSGGNLEAALGNVDAPAGQLSDQVGNMAGMRTIYNTHDHNETGGVTDAPNQGM